MQSQSKFATTNVAAVNAQVEDVKKVMEHNVKIAMDRGAKLDSLDKKADKLKDNAHMFQKTAEKAKRTFYLKNAKWTMFLIIFVIAIILVIGLTVYFSVKK